MRDKQFAMIIVLDIDQTGEDMIPDLNYRSPYGFTAFEVPLRTVMKLQTTQTYTFTTQLPNEKIDTASLTPKF